MSKSDNNDLVMAGQERLPSTAFLLCGASLPLGVGALIGYRRQLSQSSMGVGGSGDAAAAAAAHNVNRMAVRALAVGTGLSLGGVSLLVGGLFFALGCKNVDDFVEVCQVRIPQKRIEWERTLLRSWNNSDNFNDGDSYTPPSMRHPDVLATKNMTEEEELEYLQKKYFSGTLDDNKDENEEN